jgi:hypothetical protein
MKKLSVTYTGFLAAASAFCVVAPAIDAQAITLTASRTGTLAKGGASGDLVQPLTIRDPAFADAGAVEVGEFLRNESRAFAEYDLSGFSFDPDSEYTVGFNVFSEGGTNSAGSTGLGNNAGNPLVGDIFVSWYRMDGSVFDSPFTFDPELPTGGNISPFSGLAFPTNPLLTLDSSDYVAGNRIEIDVTNLVKNILVLPIPPQSFGLMLWADGTDASLGEGLGKCGASADRQCQAVSFNNFGITEVPTPAAILPSLLGMLTAASRRKEEEA